MPPGKIALEEHVVLPALSAPGAAGSALIDTLLEVGTDRILFSVDYPYENMQEQSDWFDSLPISPADRARIGRDNARALFFS